MMALTLNFVDIKHYQPGFAKGPKGIMIAYVPKKKIEKYFF